MENIELIISLATACIGLLGAAVAFVVKLVATIAQQVKEHGLSALIEVAQEFMSVAENLDGLSGDEKLEFVLKAISDYASENGIEYDEADITAKVEQLVNFTKQLNIK